MRYKTKVGEIDIVARRDSILCFIEVKYRPTTAEALFAVSDKARQRIRRAGEYYMLGFLKESNKLDYQIRFDVIGINKNFLIRHIKNAF